MTNPNWDHHYSKHCVRYYGWVPVSKSLKKRFGKRSIKYFTLCAAQALDVFALEKEGVLERDKNRRLPNVIICERKYEVASEILRVIRPPLREAVLIGDLASILTYEKSKLEKLKGIFGKRSIKVRRYERIRDLNERLLGEFPFHIINFDPCGNIFTPRLDRNKLFLAFTKIFEHQRGNGSFLLFLTTEAEEIDPISEKIFKRNTDSNISLHPEIREALFSYCRAKGYDDIDERNKRLSLGISKSVVIPAAVNQGWLPKHHGIYLYENPNSNLMLNSVLEFVETDTSSPDNAYIDDVVTVIREMPTFFSFEEAERNREVRDHLDDVIARREAIREEFN